MKSIELADLLLEEIIRERTPQEKKKEEWLGKLMDDSSGRLFITDLADLAFRSESSKRVVNQLSYLIETLSIPKCLSESERFKLLMLSNFGHLAPRFFLKQVQKQILDSLKEVMLSDHPKRFFEQARQQAIRVNLNHLGEAILGEKEAEARMARYLQDLKEDEVDYISIKISTLYSQIRLVAWDHTLSELKTRLRKLYRATKPHQFVNLDMEEFHDLDLTVTLFKEVLDEPEFKHLHAGVALQAYIPDSFAILQELAAWAKKRAGAPIRIRLVKGANIPMEQIEAEMKSWTAAPFAHKWETDANYKRMLDFALLPEHAENLHIGVATHNLFDIAYALILRSVTKSESRVSFEMLSGMAMPLQRIIRELTGGLTLYCPAAEKRHFQHAISYLIRRFDENGSPQNFMRHFFELQPKNFAWEQETKRFKYACKQMNQLSLTSRREIPRPTSHEPPIDFALCKNRDRLSTIYTPKAVEEIPIVIGGVHLKGTLKEGKDPSLDHVFYHYHSANKQQIDQAFEKAEGECPHPIFKEVIRLMRERRDHLITVLIADGGKTIDEADPEISEAIDFVSYYSTQWIKKGKPRGTLLVAPPWNFPAAIPTGGITAALVTGNAVLFKPASDTTLIGWEIAKIFWEAGVPKTTLQFIPCDGEETKRHLITHPQLAGMILTGATETARHILQLRPTLHLMAETGGKNAIIVTALSDRDLAIRDLISSAFGHSGQKCSACSLGILESEVYQSKAFLAQLKDATESLAVGSCWDPKIRLGPLIRPPEPKLLKALTTLDEGESWLVQPKKIKENLWTPGIKLGVRKGSFFHQTECFGPVLGLMEAKNLNHAIELVNSTPYGLTSGLHSLDPREHLFWKKRIEAGNLYINRNITGAIVGRQPFGGCKASSFGPGFKAGGPLYCDQLVYKEEEEPTERGILPQPIVSLMKYLSQLTAEEQKIWKKSVESYAYWAQKYQNPIDLANLVGQQNLYYMVPKACVIIRYQNEPFLDLLRVLAACLICDAPFILSSVKQLDMGCVVEDDAMCSRRKGTVRLLSKNPFYPNAIATPVFSSGKLEIPNYLREISLSFDYHRYGYLGHVESSEHSST